MVVLSRSGTEYSRSVDDLVRDLEREHLARIDVVDLNSRDGSSTASLYDIMQYPAILVMQDNGQLVKDWQGTNLPPKGEISYYTHM